MKILLQKQDYIIKWMKNFGVKCFNIAILEGDYLEKGYTNNIIESFKKNPKGYFKYFQEILDKKEKNIKWNKRIYAIKHLIIFKVLCGYKNVKIKNKINQTLYYLLVGVGTIATKIKFK